MVKTTQQRRRFVFGRSRVRSVVDDDFYTSCYGRLVEETGLAPGRHFARHGHALGLMPKAEFDPCVYLTDPHAGELSFHRGGFAHDPDVPATLAAVDDHVATIDDHRMYGATNARERNDFAEQERAKNIAAAPGYADGYRRAVEQSSIGLTCFAPSFEAFHQRIVDQVPTTYVKVPHGFWDSLLFVEREQQRLRADPRFERLNDEQCFSLACRMISTVQPGKGVHAEGFYADLLAELAPALEDPDLTIAFSFKGYPTWDDRLFIMPGNADAEHARVQMLERHVPAGYDFADGTMFKRWTLSGDLPTLMETLASRPVVVIGSALIEPIIARFDFGRAIFHEIPALNTHWQRYALVDAVDAIMRRFATDEAPVVLTQAGGSLSFWLLLRLRRRFPHASFLDLGQALNPYLVDEPNAPWMREYESVLFGAD